MNRYTLPRSAPYRPGCRQRSGRYWASQALRPALRIKQELCSRNWGRVVVTQKPPAQSPRAPKSIRFCLPHPTPLTTSWTSYSVSGSPFPSATTNPSRVLAICAFPYSYGVLPLAGGL